jgi:hypothetical protein
LFLCLFVRRIGNLCLFIHRIGNFAHVSLSWILARVSGAPLTSCCRPS